MQVVDGHIVCWGIISLYELSSATFEIVKRCWSHVGSGYSKYQTYPLLYLFRVTSCLENLEMSGNLKHVRDMLGKNLVREKCPKTVHY